MEVAYLSEGRFEFNPSADNPVVTHEFKLLPEKACKYRPRAMVEGHTFLLPLWPYHCLPMNVRRRTSIIRQIVGAGWAHLGCRV